MGRYNYILRTLLLFIPFISIIQFQTGCKKFVEIDTPPDRITQENVFSSDRSAITVLTGIYTSLERSGADMALYTGLLTDELTLWDVSSQELFAYYTNSLASNPQINTGKAIWESYYNYIFRCNAALEGLVDNKFITPSVKQQLLGESYFLRAWLYFNLLNFYGDLPIAVSTNSEVNRLLKRSPVQTVYHLIVDDLLKAQELLSSDYLNGQLKPYEIGHQERVRPSRWAADALLARVYLYTEQWAKAESEAGKVIVNATLFNLLPLTDVFLKNGQESIWQLQPVDAGWNSPEARIFSLSAIPSGLSSDKPVYLSSFFLNSFEPNDQRRNYWTDSLDDGTGIYYFPVKYKDGNQNSMTTRPEHLTEYSVVLRLGEQYLIRAESRARQNNLLGAIADLDMIRIRAGLPSIATSNPAISQQGLLEVILHERQVELFTEWGHRWLDLKRYNKADEVMGVVAAAKGGEWENTDLLLPIPYSDLLFNPNLTQNKGY